MTLRILCMALGLMLSTNILTAQKDAIKGVWLTEDGKAKVEIGEGDGGYFYGKIIWLKEPIDPETGQPKLDKHNPDGAKKSLPIMGSILIWGYKFNNNEYVGGNVYDAREGKTYDGKLWLEDNNRLKMRGYWGPFYKTEVWTRVQ